MFGNYHWNHHCKQQELYPRNNNPRTSTNQIYFFRVLLFIVIKKCSMTIKRQSISTVVSGVCTCNKDIFSGDNIGGIHIFFFSSFILHIIMSISNVFSRCVMCVCWNLLIFFQLLLLLVNILFSHPILHYLQPKIMLQNVSK